MCNWNLEPSDPLLLKVTMKYSANLRNAQNTELAILILKTSINNAQEHLNKNNLTDKSSVELLITDLINRFEMYMNERNTAKYIEQLVPETLQDTLIPDF